MSLVFLGDLHLSVSKPWSSTICEKFLDWYKDWDLNNKENSIIFLGDLVDSAQNGGKVIDYLERLYINSNFKHIYIVVGNHDYKIINNIPQLAYEFFNQKENVTIFKSITEIEIDGYKGLMLPYYVGVNDSGYTMNEYYSNIYKNKLFKNDYDFVAGHISSEDATFGGSIDCVSNLDKLSGKKVLGHIHTRTCNPYYFTGSMYALSKSENDDTRCAFVLSDNAWSEYTLPVFNEFITFSYPDELPRSKAIVPIYTILNCSSEFTARQKYKNIFIRKTISDSVEIGSKLRTGLDRQDTDNLTMSTTELFSEFLKVQTPPLSRSVVIECTKMIKDK